MKIKDMIFFKNTGLWETLVGKGALFTTAWSQSNQPTYTAKLKNLGNIIMHFIIISMVIQFLVCKLFFKATLDINNRITNKLLPIKKGLLEVYLRGERKNRKKVEASIKQGVREHIRSNTRIESHSFRKETTRKYIDSGKKLMIFSMTTNKNARTKISFTYN